MPPFPVRQAVASSSSSSSHNYHRHRHHHHHHITSIAMIGVISAPTAILCGTLCTNLVRIGKILWSKNLVRTKSCAGPRRAHRPAQGCAQVFFFASCPKGSISTQLTLASPAQASPAQASPSQPRPVQPRPASPAQASPGPLGEPANFLTDHLRFCWVSFLGKILLTFPAGLG